MKYAVIYQSKCGNTRRVAETIYDNLLTEDKGIFDLDREPKIPVADVYLVGFGVRQGTCTTDIIRCFDQITSGQFALFATCGNAPTRRYKRKLERRLDIWMPDDSEYLGMFLCQGRFERKLQNFVLKYRTNITTKLKGLFEKGDAHPNSRDFKRAALFARAVQKKVELGINLYARRHNRRQASARQKAENRYSTERSGHREIRGHLSV